MGEVRKTLYTQGLGALQPIWVLMRCGKLLSEAERLSPAPLYISYNKGNDTVFTTKLSLKCLKEC